jgi:HD-like signal output (HDOD) protein
LRIAALQDADRPLRSSAAQRQVLGIALADLEQALMRRWQLPELLARITNDKHERDPQVRCVYLAVRLARHTARGWDDAGVPDDLHDIAELLNLSESHALKLLHEFD